MQTVFAHLITHLITPSSQITISSANLLGIDPSRLSKIIKDRIHMGPQELYNNIMNIHERYVNDIESNFAQANLVPVHLWINFFNQVKVFLVEQEQMLQQQQMQQQQQQYAQQQMQRQQPQQPYEAEPVLGTVHPMPQDISDFYAYDIERRIKKGLLKMPPSLSIPRPEGGKKSRSKKRGRKSIHRRKKSMHKKRK